MTWVVASFISAFFIATRAILDKHLLGNLNLCSYEMGFRIFIVPAIIFIFPALYLQQWVYLTNPYFLLLALGNTIFNVSAFFCYSSIMRHNDASILYSAKSLEPLILGVLAFIFLGEFLSPAGIAGIAIIFVGCWLLERSREQTTSHKGTAGSSGYSLILLYVVLTAMATVCSKAALNVGAIVIYICVRYMMMSVVMFFLKNRQNADVSKREHTIPHLNKILISGVFVALDVLFEMYALTLTNAAYVDALRKISIIMIFGMEVMFLQVILNPKRLTASLIMLLGVLLICFQQGL